MGWGSSLPRQRRLLLISELRLLFDVEHAGVVDDGLGKLVEAAHDLRAQVFNLYLVLIMWNLSWIWLVW